MRHEISSYVVRPGAVADIETRAMESAGQGLPAALAAFWHTEIGTLNEIVQIWSDDDPSRGNVLVDAELTLSRHTELWEPAPFMRPMIAGEYGGVFEMRTYTFRPGTMPNVLDEWAGALPARRQLSPLIGCWYTAVGGLDRFRHVWSYRSLEERARIRKEALKLPRWPPQTREWRLFEENKILIPAAFSPIR